MKDSKVAKRYAKSLIDLAQEHKIAAKVFEDMTLVADTCRKSKELSMVLQSPIININKKEAIVKQIFGNKTDKMTASFLDIIVRKRRENYLEQIAVEYISMYKSSLGISTAYIITAVPIDEKLRNEIMGLMKKQGDGKVELVEQVKADLIGGFILRYGNVQLDASVSRKLKTLSKEFRAN
jgi:F-type H+-transporting ATPase subunit delta